MTGPVPALRSVVASFFGAAPVGTVNVGEPFGSGSFRPTHGLPLTEVSSAEVVDVVVGAAAAFLLSWVVSTFAIPSAASTTTTAVVIAIPMRLRRSCTRWRSACCAAMRSRWRFWRARTSFDDGIGRERYSPDAATFARMSGPETTVDLLRSIAAEHPDRAAFVDAEHRLTFGAWDRAADGGAGWLADRGVGRGDVVALLVPSSIEYAGCYQAAMRLRAITTGINTRLGPPEIRSILDRTTPRVVIGEAELAEVRAAFDGTPPPVL